MRGDTNTEDVAEGDGYGTSGTGTAAEERRPSITTLQNMLKKASQSQFHDQHKNGISGDVARINPLYKYYLESGNKDYGMNNEKKEISEDETTDTVLAAEFQSTPLDLKPRHRAMENGNQLSERQKDPFQTSTHNPVKDFFQKSSVGQITSARGSFYDVTLNSPDLFEANPIQPKGFSKTIPSKSSGILNNEVGGLFSAGKSEELFPTGHAKDVSFFNDSPSTFVDPFRAPSSNEDDVFMSPQLNGASPFSVSSTSKDHFQVFSTKSEDLFHAKENKQDHCSEERNSFVAFSKENLDIFSTSSTNDPFDPFPSPIRGDLFQDVSSLDDRFGTTTSKQYDPFHEVSNRTSDIFQPLEQSRSPPQSFSGLKDIVLTTPEGTKYDILQPTPFVRARNLAMSAKHSPTDMSHVPTIKRPPKPLPRTKLLKTGKPPTPEKLPTPENPSTPEKPPTPEKRSTPEKLPTPENPFPLEKPPPPKRPPKPERQPLLATPVEPEAAAPKLSPKAIIRRLSKPVISRKPKSPDSKEVHPENFVVFEDILLTGQERCVEDWPEDSPEVVPGYKPSGKFKLRRESWQMKADSDGGSGEDISLTQTKKKDKKFRMSLISRRGSKDMFSDTKEGRSRSRTLSFTQKSPKDYFSDPPIPGENGEHEEMDYKKPQKIKPGRLRRPSSPSLLMGVEGKYTSGNSLQESKGTVLENSSGEEEEEGVATQKEKSRKKMKLKFVPKRGFAITREKSNDEPKGAYGCTPRKESMDDPFEDVEQLKNYQLSSSKAAFMDEDFHKTQNVIFDEDINGLDDKPKKNKKMKVPFIRRSSKEDMLEDNTGKKNSFSAEELDDDDLYALKKSATKTPKYRGHVPFPHTSRVAGQSEFAHEDDFGEDDYAGKDFLKPGESYDSKPDELETYKQKKSSKPKFLKKHKAKSKSVNMESDDPPGAAYLSEAAKAEWMAAQRDEQALSGLEDEDADGDTDSLMEWWYTVEQWDEVPSDEEDMTKKDDSKSFTILADKVNRGLRLFNKVFTERAEVLWQSSITLNAVAEDITDFHHKAKIAGITGGTTTAVGGVAAIAGLALAPFTFGASLVVTAVGVGVAAAGGITSASAAISDNVNNMQDRKKVEIVLKEYETHLLTIGKILHFVDQGLYRLRGHPFLRSGTQHYSEDWEIRKAVQMISLVDSPVRQAVEVTDTAVSSVQGLFKGTDKYFIKESGELKKSCKKEMVALIKEVSNVLNASIMELNTIREELQNATGDF